MSCKITLRPMISLTVILIAVLFLQACRTITPPEQVKRLSDTEEIRLDKIIPKPVSAVSAEGVFQIVPSSAIYTDISSGELSSIGRYLSERLNTAAGHVVRVNNIKSAVPSKGNIFLLLSDDSLLGEEGYQLNISADSLVLRAFRPAGLFRGIQSIRQLLPSDIELNSVAQGPLTIACGVIRDYPRFAWRGVMLDVSRHFFKPEDVKRYIDLIALYKMNRFHLHLGDDQGWRLEIKSWPNLAIVGGSTQVDGGKGGYYTQEEFKDIINYAAARYITVIPEFDMPGHTNAALASYPELNENGIAPQLYTGTKVGFSSLAIGKEETYKFADDLAREISHLMPGGYIHMGGDEAHSTKEKDYIYFVERMQSIIKSYGLKIIGWEDIAAGNMNPDVIAQHWVRPNLAQKAVSRGMKLIMSPSSRTYIDMKYTKSTQLGLDWAGLIEAKYAYDWDPATLVPGVTEENILGIEAPLWAETITKVADIEFMAFPRVPGYAEMGWSQADGRKWEEYRNRIGGQGPRLRNMNINFYASPEIPWK